MSARVILYSRPGCHLCDDARAVVEAVCAETQVQWQEVNVDLDPELQSRYGDEVPVVRVDDATVGFWHIDPVQVRAALR